jgi:glycosyltransferase involved in cell wall biosynthesis
MARTIRRNPDITILFLCHNVVPHEKRPGDTVLTKYALAPADGFIVQSASVERDLLELIPHARHELVPHPVYSSFGASMPAEEARRNLGTSAKFVLLFFGYVRAYKGLGTLLDAMALLKGHLDIHLFVVGEFYDEVRRYRETLSSLGLDAMVTVRAEYISHEEARVYFSAADAAVLPYLSATQSGIAQVAYNFDTPVIATSVGGLAEVVKDGLTGFLVPPGDPGSLAAAINRFFTTTDRDAMRLRIREEKKKYSWDTLVDAIERLTHRT